MGGPKTHNYVFEWKKKFHWNGTKRDKNGIKIPLFPVM
jgi:hypothetical protein